MTDGMWVLALWGAVPLGELRMAMAAASRSDGCAPAAWS